MIHSSHQKVKKKGIHNEFDEKAIVDFVHRHHFRSSLRAAGCSRWAESAAGRHAVWREYSVKTLKWGLLYTAAFLAAFVGSALLKINSDPTHGKYNTRWDETIGKAYTDLPYGEGAANKFDLYVPADKSQDAYGLVVYLHAGGFTVGDKAGDAENLAGVHFQRYALDAVANH